MLGIVAPVDPTLGLHGCVVSQGRAVGWQSWLREETLAIMEGTLFETD